MTAYTSAGDRRRRYGAHCLLLYFASAPFVAHGADIDTSFGGFVKLQAAMVDPARPLIEGDGTRIDGELHLDVDGQTDTGVTYGGRLQLVRAAKPRDNGTYVEAGWAWGEFRLGDYGGAAKELAISAPNIGVGQIDGDLDRFGAPSALMAPYALNNDDSTRITYLSPNVLGLRLGISYAPELAGGGIEAMPERHLSGIDRQRNVTEFALNVSRDIGETTVSLGGAAVFGEALSGSHLHDLAGGSLGAKVVWDRLTVGGAFVYDGADTLPVDPRPGHVDTESIVSEVNLGATYDLARWGFGLSWAHDYRKAEASTDLVAAGIVYRIARGVTLGADLAHFSRPRGQGLVDGTALMAETAVHF